ncbi:MAG TPA: HEAT repeat domain-containing protein [Steroidobacteraceae bacterium]|nr:HEAT repeat domain-containing protein [Steroidobacteraceae bacterium]
MGFLSNLRSDRLISQIKSTDKPLSEETLKAVARLKSVGSGAIEPVIAALADSDKNATVALVDVLSHLVSNKSFPQVLQGLRECNSRTAQGIGWALSSSRNYAPHLLLDALNTKDVPKPALMEAIQAQRDRFSLRELLTAAYNQEPSEKAALFRIIAEIATPDTAQELVSRLEGKDPIARMHIINILAKFNRTDIKRALQGQLRDNNKMIRAAALSALARMDGPVDVELLCQLLRDPEIDVQNRAIDVLIRANDPETIKYLIPVLKDENEYSRRAAVEVLNEIGDARSVKFLLAAIKDDDWWVRSRAGDALGKIGGPKVIDAVLQLARDQDEDIRRSAIEILNQTKDERAISHLIEATRDQDWWVSERSVDALAAIGNKRALPRMLEMLGTTPPRSLPVVVRAVGKLGEGRNVEQLLPLLQRPEKEVRIEAMHALAAVSDEKRCEHVRGQLQALTQAAEPSIGQAAQAALRELGSRMEGTAAAATQLIGNLRPGQASGSVAGELARAGSMDESDLKPVLHEVEEPRSAATLKLDITTLKNGEIIEGRYKFIERIGKGAFGTVLLMEDTVVDDRLILKFLNPNVSEDEEMMKRFVHELRYSRKITHHNVIRIYDFLQIQGIYAISMEYFPSHTLGAEVVNEQPVETKKAVKFGIDMCTGMAVAHKVGIVHRDLKPANVLINNEGLLKIVDFGVAAAHREGDTQLTKTGYVIGSPKYMAPEQILGRKVDERADIYAIGVILYELFTGVPPYARGDHMAVMYQHVQGKARPPLEVNPKLSPGIAELIMKAMTVDKTKRFQTMDEMRIALERFA